MVEKKLRLRRWDLSGEIRAEILRISLLRMSKIVGWRSIWRQKGVILGPLGFQARLAPPRAPRGVFLPTPVDPTALFLAGAFFFRKK